MQTPAPWQRPSPASQTPPVVVLARRNRRRIVLQYSTADDRRSKRRWRRRRSRCSRRHRGQRARGVIALASRGRCSCRPGSASPQQMSPPPVVPPVQQSRWCSRSPRSSSGAGRASRPRSRRCRWCCPRRSGPDGQQTFGPHSWPTGQQAPPMLVSPGAQHTPVRPGHRVRAATVDATCAARAAGVARWAAAAAGARSGADGVWQQTSPFAGTGASRRAAVAAADGVGARRRGGGRRRRGRRGGRLRRRRRGRRARPSWSWSSGPPWWSLARTASSRCRRTRSPGSSCRRRCRTGWLRTGRRCRSRPRRCIRPR